MTSLFFRAVTRGVAAGLLVCLAVTGRAQSPGMPGMPAAPLAGGQAALAGGSYVDAHGNQIVMPASYGASCSPYGEECGAYGDGGYCGDPNAGYVDFGGYGPDQCGPYYFDISLSGVFLTSEEAFLDVPPLASVTALGPTIIEPDALNDDYEVGWQIAARYDLGPLSVIEATYMGIYDLGFHDTRFSEVETLRLTGLAQPDQLQSVFSGYGSVQILGLDSANQYDVDYQSDLQSTELSYRRYWLGYSERISGTYLLGARYLRMTEDFNFDSITDTLTGFPNTGNLLWSADNDVVGFQFGGDAWICLRQGLRLGGETKAGVYNNRYKFRHATSLPDPAIDNVDFSADGNQVAFAGESSVDLVADILPSFSIRAGYRALYMSSLVTVGNNIDPNNVVSTALYTEADALYHGFHAGLEYIW
jgi:hypothetical protein